jgi:hypothetical protein
MRGRLKARETVARETPAAVATSRIVGAEEIILEDTLAVYALATVLSMTQSKEGPWNNFALVTQPVA